jgi:hypothetical protein
MRSFERLGLGVLALLAATATLSAHSGGSGPAVYVTSPNNEIIRIVDLLAGKAEVAIRDKGTKFQGLVVYRSGSDQDPVVTLIAANKTQGGDIRAYDAEMRRGGPIAKFKDAHGVAVSQEGDVFAVNRHRDRNDQLVFVPRRGGCNLVPLPLDCRGNGAYGVPLFIDSDVMVNDRRTEELGDVKVAKTSGGRLVQAGQVVVLVKDPPMLVSYSPPGHDWEDCGGNCEPSSDLLQGRLNGYTPVGLEIASGGVLIATEQKVILEASVDVNGDLVVEEFADLAGKGAKLSVGARDSQEVVYATVPNVGGKLQAFDIHGDEIKSLKVKVPEGVGNETSATVFTPTGPGVKVSLPSFTATFDLIRDGGSGPIDGNCGLFPYPDGWQPGDELHLSDLPGLDVDPEEDALIPDHIVPYSLNGRKLFYICSVNSEALWDGTVELVADEETVYEDESILCESQGTAVNAEARMFWEIDGVLTDISSGCSSNIGRGHKFSLGSPAATDSRSICEIQEEKLTALEARLDDFADFITGDCPGDNAAPGPVPETVFSHPSLGLNKDDWTYVDPASGVFGADGNGLLVGGGTFEVRRKDAGFNHAFGVAHASDATILTPIVPNSGTPPAGPVAVPVADGSYRLYFENLGRPGEIAFSDGQGGNPSLEIATYRRKSDPRQILVFIDDGGGGPDKDFEDLVISASGEVAGTECNLRLALADANVAFSDCTADTTDVVGMQDRLTEFAGIVVDAPDGDIDDSDRNRSGELRARALSALFIGGKLVYTFAPSP